MPWGKLGWPEWFIPSLGAADGLGMTKIAPVWRASLTYSKHFHLWQYTVIIFIFYFRV